MLSSRSVFYALSAVFLLSPLVEAEQSGHAVRVSVDELKHPFLTKELQVPWSRLTPDRVKPDISIALTNAERAVEWICALTPDRMDYDHTFGALEQLRNELDVYWTRVNVLSNVRDEPALREVMKEMMSRVSEFESSLTKNKKLWEVLKKAEERMVEEPLSHDQARLVSETMILFRDSGADLPVVEQERLLQIDKALTDWTKKFSDVVQDNQSNWSLVVEDESELAGLSQAVKNEAEQAAAKDARTDGKRRWKFTYNSATQGGLMTHLKSEALRRRVWEGISSIGTGSYDTEPMIRKILQLRDEKAKLCGCRHYPDYILKRRMAGSGKTALQFVDGLHGRINKIYKAEIADLRKFKEKKTGLSTGKLAPWETAYWESQQKQELYSFDPESIRTYYPVDNVMKELFFVVSSLFDIDVKERKTVCLSAEKNSGSIKGAVEVWDPAVRFFEVYDKKTSEHLGSFYLDIYPRGNKRSGAWMGPMIQGHPAMGDQPRQPHLGMIGANIRPPMGGEPALLTQREMCTLFHEMGHLMHLMLSEVSVPSLAGTAVAWDFVELPSQIMENWCWDRSILKEMSSHYQTGEKIPDSLLNSLLKSRFYHPAEDLMKQLALSKLDLELHKDPAILNNMTLEQVDDKILAGYKAPFSDAVPSRARAMRHLFASVTGYSAGYYSYRWAELLEADAFSRFSKEGLLNPKVGDDFRRSILEKGNVAAAEELFRDFMGRDPDKEAMLKRRGLNKK